MNMFGLFGGKKIRELKEETRSAFKEVKKDFKGTSAWIKHLDKRDKQLFELVSDLKIELSTINNEIEGVKEAIGFMNLDSEHKQVSKKEAVYEEQTPVPDVQTPVQTPVQTGSFYDILHGLSANERLIVFTLMNADMKLSYEDLARLLGKERSTIRGQINSIKQKNEDLIKVKTEPSGKKRLFVESEIKEKLEKYAKVKAGGNKKKLKDYSI